jgi:hypothetical protein
VQGGAYGKERVEENAGVVDGVGNDFVDRLALLQLVDAIVALAVREAAG